MCMCNEIKRCCINRNNHMVYTEEELKTTIEVILTIYIIVCIHAYTYIFTLTCDISESDHSTVLGHYENFPNEEVSSTAETYIYIWPELD